MMVLFVSQCEKNALAKTRRVLDAFADRIGDNTWQTIITEEGLQTVKKLLRQTASKSTAVSCHWIRSRSRSDLLWVVGNKRKFNERGVVPVNYTGKDVVMDVMTMKPKENENYANTQLQLLAEHMFAVGYLSKKIFELSVENDEHNKLSEITFLAGCLHDIGKLDPLFQEWVKKGKQKDTDDDGQHIDTTFRFEKHPRHNEISLFLFNVFEAQITGLNPQQKTALQHVIYWHHAKPYRKKDDFTGAVKVFEYLKKNIKITGVEKLIENAPKMVNRIISLIKKYELSDELNITSKLGWQSVNIHELLENFEYAYKAKGVPEFKEYQSTDTFSELQGKVKINAHHNLLRACVISADRIISALRPQDLMDYIVDQRLNELLAEQEEIESNMTEHIENSLKLFPDSERTKKQAKVAKELAKLRDVAVISGAAGCGKTKIALEWAMLNKAKKIIWVCPRVQVCQGIFEELTTNYLPDTNIEIYTGEFKFKNNWDELTNENEYFSGDVIVTTIDQILNSITTHTKADGLIPFMQAHIVFDEYHEYVNMEIFNLLFAELVASKNMRKRFDKRILLVSATPHYTYLKNILGLEAEYDVVEMPSFNQSKYKIQFVEFEEKTRENNPFYQTYSNNTFIISNTAKLAQQGFLFQKDNENAVLFHSKFKRSDKKHWFSMVYEAFKKDGTRQYDVLRSGPIVQASLNISCDAMTSEMSSPENILQRLGRLDRFGENKETNVLTIPITQDVKNGKQVGSSAKFLAKLHCLQSAKAWYAFLEEKLSGKIFTLSEIYTLYRDFDSWAAREVNQDLEQAIKGSIQLLSQKVTEPIKMINTKSKDRKQKISKNSLRGDSRFVQMAKLEVNNLKSPVYLNEYAYKPPLQENEEFDNLTESASLVKDVGLLQFIAQKHSNIDTSHPVKGIPANKMTLRHLVLENYARDADYPLYLSYIEDDLNLVGGTDTRHSEAIYYVVCDRQPIGSMSIKVIDDLND